MAANRFATMLHRNTNKITLILIYAVLEWVLIVLLLLNSLFSHLIIKFAEFFGLKPPCPWCTRVDHLFDPAKGDRNMNSDFICEIHSKEISKLGFCSIHQKLVDSQDMCEDCLLSRPEIERNFGLLGKVKELGVFLCEKEKVGENGEVSLNCSCCGVSLANNSNKDKYSSYALLKTSSWDDVLEYAQKEENLIPESGDFVSDVAADENVLENKSENQMISEFDGDLGNTDKNTEENGFISVTVNELRELEIGANEILKDETSNSIMKDKSVQVCVEEDKSLENSNQHLEFFLDYSGHKLVPIELIDLVTEENENAKIEEGNLTKDREICVVSEVRVEDAVVFERKSRNTSFLDVDINEEAKDEMFESMEIEEDENSLFFHAKGSYMETDEFEHFGVFPLAEWPSEDTSNVQELAGAEMENHSDVQTDNVACEEASQGNNEVEADVSIGTEIPDLDIQEMAGVEMENNSDVQTDNVACEEASQGNNENEADVSVGTQIPDLDIQELAGVEMENHSDVQTDNVACEEASQGNTENEADVSVGTQIPDLDINNEIQIENADHSYASIHEHPLTNSTNIYADNDHGSTQVDEQNVETQSVSIQDSENMPNNQPAFQKELKETEEDKFLDTPTSVNDELQSVPIQDSEHTPNNQPTFQMELIETEEDTFPDTPTSIDLDKKLLLLEKRDSWTEGSVDGSVTSELDGGDGVVTIERLKMALRSERKALQALYTELEEERSASAVATNQTMAMINRLQEEKAAMQMEALQYQRMMEEQSEYDQEALQLLNELMVKREKEKQEVERELEVYRKKLSDYETREKIRALKKSRDGSVKSGFSSASCSNAEDSDGLSVDLNQDAKEDEGVFTNSEFSNQNTPVDAVVNLEESLDDFEEERLSILEQLKVLEEKLVTLDDENEEIFEDVNGSDDLHENGHSNGYSNGKHYTHRRIAGQKGKSLLPLFDAISDENGDGAMVNGNGFDHDSFESKFDMENKKDAIGEEVDHLYERLQALEADREFLKHCMSSLKKGDKGMDLLQEILQHLRDLRNVELRARNFGDGAVN